MKDKRGKATELHGQLRSQMEFGNEGNGTAGTAVPTG